MSTTVLTIYHGAPGTDGVVTSLTTTGSSGAATLVSGVLNIPTPTSSGLAIFARNASTNASGNTTLSIAATTRHHTEIMTVSGDPRTSEIVVPVTGRVDGDIVKVRFINTVNGVTLNLRNATVGGSVIYSCVSNDGNAAFEMYFDGTAFQPLFNAQPVA